MKGTAERQKGRSPIHVCCHQIFTCMNKNFWTFEPGPAATMAVRSDSLLIVIPCAQDISDDRARRSLVRPESRALTSRMSVGGRGRQRRAQEAHGSRVALRQDTSIPVKNGSGLIGCKRSALPIPTRTCGDAYSDDGVLGTVEHTGPRQ